MPEQDEYTLKEELNRLRDVVAKQGSDIFRMSTELAAMKERLTFFAVFVSGISVLASAIAAYLK